ncbi:EAL domain-containing protein [Marinomonas sp.]|uniref:EAL domain-containing protein n=1 Tax=Marinomonas sp. TaxID=1904862 RepID=UPI003BA9B5F8
MSLFREVLALKKTYKMIFLCLLFFSFFVVLFANSQYNIKTLDLIEMAKKNEVVIEASGTDVNLTRKKNSFLVECWVKVVGNDICGIFVGLPDNNGFGFSLNDFDSLDFNITQASTSKSYDERIRVFVRTNLSSKEEIAKLGTQYKYHAVRIKADGNKVVPLTRFKVETWWEDMNRVPFELAYYDISNVSSIEFFFNEMPVLSPGKYSMSLSDLKISGKIINQNLLYKILTVLWLFVAALACVLYLIIKYKELKKLKGQAYRDSYVDLFNALGFELKYSKYIGKKTTVYRVKIINWQSLLRHFGLSTANHLLNEVIGKNAPRYRAEFYLSARLNENDLVFIKKGERFSEEIEKDFIDSLITSINIIGLGDLCLDVKVGVSEEISLPENKAIILERTEISIQSILNSKSFLQLYTNDVGREAEKKAHLESLIKVALKKDAFYLLYMPLYRASSKKIVGVEALLRCSLPELYSLSPEVYVSVAEETGLIRDIDFMVIEKALADFKIFELREDFTLSINISSKELLDTSFVHHFKERVLKSGISFEKLCLEITETFLLDIDATCIKTLSDIRSMGCRVSLDDFGTGYTSFQQLINFPADEIKIDKGFVSGIQNDKGYGAIVDSLILIADSYQYTIVAEGVETRDVYQLLTDKGCDLFQGYYISKPVSLNDIVVLSNKIEDGGL